MRPNQAARCRLLLAALTLTPGVAAMTGCLIGADIGEAGKVCQSDFECDLEFECVAADSPRASRVCMPQEEDSSG